jgi:hypothetical protein
MILEYETAEKKCPCLKASLRLGREAAQTCFIADKYYSEQDCFEWIIRSTIAISL